MPILQMPTHSMTLTCACCNRPAQDATCEFRRSPSSHLVHAGHALHRPGGGRIVAGRDACLRHVAKIVEVLPALFCFQNQRFSAGQESILQAAGCLGVHPPPVACTLLPTAILPMFGSFNVPRGRGPSVATWWCRDLCGPGSAWRAINACSGRQYCCAWVAGGRCRRERGFWCPGWLRSLHDGPHRHGLDEERPRPLTPRVGVQHEVVAATAPPPDHIIARHVMVHANGAERARQGPATWSAGCWRRQSARHHRKVG